MRNNAAESEELREFESPETRAFNELLRDYFAQMPKERVPRQGSGIDIIRVPKELIEALNI